MSLYFLITLNSGLSAFWNAMPNIFFPFILLIIFIWHSCGSEKLPPFAYDWIYLLLLRIQSGLVCTWGKSNINHNTLHKRSLSGSWKRHLEMFLFKFSSSPHGARWLSSKSMQRESEGGWLRNAKWLFFLSFLSFFTTWLFHWSVLFSVCYGCMVFIRQMDYQTDNS